MGAGRARGTWGRVQPSPGISCGSRVQSSVVAHRGYVGSVVHIVIECSQSVVKGSLGASMSLCFKIQRTTQALPGAGWCVCLDLLERVTARHGMEKTMTSSVEPTVSLVSVQ